ncbi:MAG: helix-turn-helix transcriptional regulator [Rhodospirillales bacterium]
MIYARQGVMSVETQAGVWTLPPQRALWVPARLTHAIDCRTAVSLRTLYLGGSAARLVPACCVVSVSDLLRAVVLRLVEGPLGPGQRPQLEALLASELVASEAEPLRLPRPGDARLGRIADAWAADPADPRGLAEWARDLALSERSLIRLIVKGCGMTFRQWQRQARLLAALEGLAAGRSVTTVALDCGYNSLSAFVQSFRSVFGVTPARYFQSESKAKRPHPALPGLGD